MEKVQTAAGQKNPTLGDAGMQMMQGCFMMGCGVLMLIVMLLALKTCI